MDFLHKKQALCLVLFFGVNALLFNWFLNNPLSFNLLYILFVEELDGLFVNFEHTSWLSLVYLLLILCLSLLFIIRVTNNRLITSMIFALLILSSFPITLKYPIMF